MDIIKSNILPWVTCLLMLLVVTGCDSSVTSEDQNADKATLNDVTFTNQMITDPDLRSTLADVKNATARYHKVSTAEAEGYAQESPFIPGMGYHYVNFSLLDGTINPMNPEVLVYQGHPVHEDKRKLGAVEYIIPSGFIDQTSQSQLEGKFPGVDSNKWHFDPHVGPDGSWTLHVWIWHPNPEGMFHPTNPRVGSGS